MTGQIEADLGWKPSLHDELMELERERAVRESVYPRMIASGRLKRSRADAQNACLDATIARLRVMVEAERAERAQLRKSENTETYMHGHTET